MIWTSRLASLWRNLVHRDAASVYRDVSQPDATIHPDYVPFAVALVDGRVLTGLVRSEGAGAIRVTGVARENKLVVIALVGQHFGHFFIGEHPIVVLVARVQIVPVADLHPDA